MVREKYGVRLTAEQRNQALHQVVGDVDLAAPFHLVAHHLQPGLLVLQRRVILQGNSWADFEAGNERVRVSHDERSVAEEEDLSVFSHNASL